MLVSHAPLLMDISLGLGALFSCSLLASDVMSGSDALVSRSVTLLAACVAYGSLAGGALALLLSILLCCCAPITPQVCLAFLPLTLVLKSHRKQLT
jgi:hypothetical protein